MLYDQLSEFPSPGGLNSQAHTPHLLSMHMHMPAFWGMLMHAVQLWVAVELHWIGSTNELIIMILYFSLCIYMGVQLVH